MDKSMQKYLDKAEVLIEALPYIQRFNRKIIVVKYGGSAMLDEEQEKRVIQDVVLLKLCGFKPIIVHGGGKEISKWVDKVGKETKFVNGFRVTDEETMEIAEMVLSKVNKKLVQLVEELGIKSIGVSGIDGGLLKVTKKYVDGEDIGYVGSVCDVEPKILFDLLEKDFLPVVCSVGLDNDFQAYNVNADEAACAIAKAVKAEKLAFLTDIEGVYKDPKDPETLIPELSAEDAIRLHSPDPGPVSRGNPAAASPVPATPRLPTVPEPNGSSGCTYQKTHRRHTCFPSFSASKFHT